MVFLAFGAPAPALSRGQPILEAGGPPPAKDRACGRRRHSAIFGLFLVVFGPPPFVDPLGPTYYVCGQRRGLLAPAAVASVAPGKMEGESPAPRPSRVSAKETPHGVRVLGDPFTLCRVRAFTVGHVYANSSIACIETN